MAESSGTTLSGNWGFSVSDGQNEPEYVCDLCRSDNIDCKCGGPCPFCAGSFRDVWFHIYISHVPLLARCWCEYEVIDFNSILHDEDAMAKFKRHCQACGGLISHYLELQLREK
jgi:hypothetical protein